MSDTIDPDNEAWPHPHIGRDLIPKGWKIGDPPPGITVGDGDVIYGAYTMNQHILSRGRIYTSQEFEAIKDDLEAYIAKRNPILEEKGRALVQLDHRERINGWFDETERNGGITSLTQLRRGGVRYRQRVGAGFINWSAFGVDES